VLSTTRRPSPFGLQRHIIVPPSLFSLPDIASLGGEDWARTAVVGGMNDRNTCLQPIWMQPMAHADTSARNLFKTAGHPVKVAIVGGLRVHVSISDV